MIEARKKAGLWHKKEADKRRKTIRLDIEKFTSNIKIDKKNWGINFGNVLLGRRRKNRK